jgi:flagellar hook assembly protein FlgD
VLVDDLAQNYPNPFNPSTRIRYSLARNSQVSLSIYNVAGQLVKTLVNDTRTAGPHAVTWDGRDDRGVPVASGVYFYRLVAGDFTKTRKLTLLK